VILALVLPLSAAASDELSLADALARAVDHNPSIAAAAFATEQAEASWARAAGVWDPTLTTGVSTNSSESQTFLAGSPLSSQNSGWGPTVGVSGLLPTGTTWSATSGLSRSVSTTSGDLTGGTPIEQDNWTGTWRLTVEQDLLAPIRPTADRVARRTAVEALDQATLSAAWTAQSALVDVAAAWWTWSTSVAAADLAGAAVAEAEALFEVTRAGHDVGNLDGVELARVEAALLQARIDQIAADATADADADDLAVLLGLDPGVDWTPGTGVASELPPGTLDDHRARAHDANPQIALARAEVEAAAAATTDARRSRLPEVSLSVSGGMGSLQTAAWDATGALFSEKGFPSTSASLTVSTPLGNRTARASVDVAAAQEAAARARLADLERQTDAQVRASLAAVEAAAQRRVLAGLRLDVARATEDGERARVDVGMLRMDELLSATRTRQEAELAVLTADRDVANARLALLLLEGGVDLALWSGA
jgi:multidrug efflux system outer membrane protein